MTLSSRRPVASAERAVLAALIVGLALLLTYGDWLWRWDRVFYDAQLRLWQRPPPDDIVIVAIDEATLRELGRWPWSRAVHAALLDRLKNEQPKAVAFDVIFAEPDLQRPLDDAEFVAAVRNSGRVGLPVLMEQPRRDGQPIETMPFPELASVAAAMGHVHVELDPDGIARSLYLFEGLGGPHWPHLSLAMLQMAGEASGTELEAPAPRETLESPLLWVRSHALLIPFAGPPGHFPHISYRQVLDGDFSPGTFRDKYVLIGTTAAGLGDALPTPFSGFSHSMSGVEINANILDTLRRGLVISPLQQTWQMLLSGLLTLLPVLAFPRLAPRSNLLVTAAVLVSTLAVSAALLMGLHLWFAPTSALLAITLSYPLWSWRRLESAMRYLGQELDQMHRQQAALSGTRHISEQASMDFITRLLPVSGWSLFDNRRQLLRHSGDAPEMPPDMDFEQRWQACGDCLWTRLEHEPQPRLLGLRWHSEQPPAASERRLLDSFIKQSGINHNIDLQSAAKDIQSRIAQVQQATSQLRELRQFIDDSLANMADGVVVADFRGQVLLSNARAAWYLRGDDNQDLIGLPLMDLLSDVILEQAGQWPDLLRQVMLEGKRSQSGAQHRNGRDLLVQVASLNTASVRLSGLVFNFSDISLLKASERKRNELLNFLSHDLRAPLVSLTALLELAKTQRPADELATLIRRMESHTGKTLNLAEQFLHLARAESSEGFVFRDVDMVSIILNASEQVWGQARGRGIQLQQQFDIDEAWISGDGGLLERALVNLLDNAIKYSEPGSDVTVTLTLDSVAARCCVTDQGCGIPAGELPRLFDRFHRVAQTGPEDIQGAGLGLALVDVVARRHGGQVEVTSEPGRGSCFCLVIPYHADKKKAG
ncbi:MAG: CHASE2 domain-containing protein [Thiogranum sp.]